MSGILFNADPEPKATRLRIFPTNLLLIDNVGINVKPLYEYILKDYHENKTRIFQMRELHKHEIFNDLIVQIQMNCSNFCNMLKYKYEYLKVTDVWANVLQPGEMHPPHTHSNNILSGVFFLTGGSNIVFTDPRAQATTIDPVKEFTMDNCNNVEYQALPKRMIIFPAWLQHWVPVNKMNVPRVSISWNVMLEGRVGGDLQSSDLHDIHDSFK